MVVTPLVARRPVELQPESLRLVAEGRVRSASVVVGQEGGRPSRWSVAMGHGEALLDAWRLTSMGKWTREID